MARNQQVQIEMAKIYQNNQQSLMSKPVNNNIQNYQVEQTRINRVTGNILCFWIITICTVSIPFINLLLFLIQPFELARGINKENLTVDNMGGLADYTYFYMVMGLYAFVSIVFVTYSCLFSQLWERFKLYVLVDTILICMLAADVSYAALHVVSFTTTYSTDEQYNLNPTFQITWQNYFVIGLYCITNLAFVGIFRIIMINIYWKAWQSIVFKIGIVLSSLLYLAVGFVYIFGNDALSKQVNDFNSLLDPIIDQCYADPNFFDVIPFLQREESSLTDAKSTINNFIILYVFTNFAFFFDIVAKISEFDGTGGLKTHYLLQEEDQLE